MGVIPIIDSGYAVIPFAIVCAIVAFLIWYPFMKRFDLKTYKKEQEEAKQNANA